MSRKTKPKPDDEQVRTTVSMTKSFWENDAEKLMQEEGYNNFSAYVSFLIKLRREKLHERRMEVARLSGKAGPSRTAFNEDKPFPKEQAS